ncbi:dynamin family protein [Paenibacillus sp. 1001270B_150601_E10]|uniref:dynamin family protein n=1 Tax=Paenibacillus sp. 1001270B_150601_E10 TaxID=2787079 RepID=UPI001E4882C6|nr:dynamin family protein [Paenibacillus sp. 1001270B_150601_E10]
MQQEVKSKVYSSDIGGAKNTNQELHEILVQLAAHAAGRDNQELELKLKDLADKANERQFVLAMCGHFSAGKSTIINQLCSRQLLPSSPIPTSANVVTVRYGESKVELIRRGSQPTGKESRYKEEVPLERLEDACRDGEQVERITIFEPIPWLQNGAALLDTPGVDSTDPLHREATESALHMADVVVYMTDYNHVQSEMNFDFAKKVAEAGKPLIWVVNQIDKHREQELPFSQYQADVRSALKVWGIEPVEIYYISMRALEHPYNEWELFQKGLQQFVQDSQELSAATLIRSALALLEEYKERELQPFKAQLEEWKASIGGEELAQSLHVQLQEKESQAEEIQRYSTKLREQVVKELDKLLKDANITPAVLRDCTDDFLKSMQPGFKVGLLFSAKKTEQEKEQRLQTLVRRFSEEVDGNIRPHVLVMIRRLASQAAADEAKAVEELDQAFPMFSGEWFINAVQPSSVGSGEYTLNYCRVQSDQAKSEIRKIMLEHVDRLIAVIHELQLTKGSKIESELQTLYAQTSKERELLKGMEAVIEEYKRLKDNLPHDIEHAELHLKQHLIEVRSSSHKVPQLLVVEEEPSSVETARSKDSDSSTAAWETFNSAAPHNRERQDRIHVLLQEAAAATKDIPALAAVRRNLIDKSERISNQRYTAALFGAFSAGKSSFANALFGESVLPVSPNPTTAAINQISLAETKEDHRTAAVRLKTEETLLEDLRYALSRLGADHAESLKMKDALKKAAQWKPDQVHPAGRPHYSFIQAVIQGYEEHQQHLGTVLHVQEEEYRQFVAVERKSAFVDRIDLLLDSPWTQQGFTFVDTPGADSVNARHTGVSFEYIKNADVIIFVTYYNHAFSQADRQFLTQLGRVKDAFELDKMFFVVNACDLASSEEERESVLQYVKERLQEFGIREPRLFPVSSLQGLEAKERQDMGLYTASGFRSFEEAFYRFVDHELIGMVEQAALSDVEKLKHQLQSLNQAAKLDSKAREEQRKLLSIRTEEAVQLISEADGTSVERFIAQESDELLYHVKQRILYRSHDSFAHAFNPATLRGDNPHIASALVQCLRDWESTLTLELTNELLATSLRLEQFAKRELQAFIKHMWEKVNALLPDYAPDDWKMGAWETPSLRVSANTWIEAYPIQERELMSLYKSSKYFFTGGGREQLRTRLDERAAQFISDSLEQERQTFTIHAWKQWLSTLEKWKSSSVEQLKLYEETMLQALDDPKQVERLEQALTLVVKKSKAYS